MKIELHQVDYSNPRHATDLALLLNAYAMDPMGGGSPLPEHVRQNIAQELSRRPQAFSLLCHVDEQPAGLVNCFEGFSTFKCRPLVNIHDIVVLREFRGLGLARRLIERVEDIARARGCCKITLEVLEGNQTAQHAYRRCGFAGYALDPAMGHALFWQKEL